MKLATSTSAATNYTRKVPTVVTYSAHLIMKPLTTHTPTTTSIIPTMDPSPISDGGRNGTVLHRTSTAVYVVVFTLWTVMVAAGLLLIFSGRRQKAIRIRDWRLIFIGVVAIHTVLAACMAGAMLHSSYTCTARYWLTSLLFPICFATYQVPNARLVSHYRANRNLQINSQPQRIASTNSLRHLSSRFTVIEQTYFVVAIGLVLQVLGTAFAFFTSRKFHRSYGLWGSFQLEPECLYGWQWVVSIVWQVVWTYGTAIFLLRQISRINDIYHWAMETRIAIFASMPGPVIWAVFMFVKNPAVGTINGVWPPTYWLIPGLAIFQSLLIGVPLLGARADARRDLEGLEAKNDPNPVRGAAVDEMMDTIANHVDPLMEYAARTKMNAELIVFLREVKRWHNIWAPIMENQTSSPIREDRTRCYKHAAMIYYRLVHMNIAIFPINISDTLRGDLSRHFRPTRYLDGRPVRSSSVGEAFPWENTDMAAASAGSSPLDVGDIKITLAEAEARIALLGEDTADMLASNRSHRSNRLIELADNLRTDVPEMFDMSIFDAAFKDVQASAYDNIWKDYVLCGQRERDAREV